MKNILVTGGAGFLGTHLCRQLLELGHKVTCLDNFVSSSKDNIKQFESNPNYSWMDRDVILPIEGDYDEIYNLACIASPIIYQNNPVETFLTSVNGINSITHYVSKARKFGKGEVKILQASTSEVYGDAREHPQSESYWGNVNPVGPRSCYDEGKRAAETLLMDHHREFETRIKICRIFNTYGPGMRPFDGRVVSTFIRQACLEENIPIFGNGCQTRSFCYVDDLISGLIMMMNSPDDFIGPVNLGNPDEFTMIELAKVIIELTKSKSKLSFVPLPVDDPKRRCPDISLAKEKLHWIPTTDIVVGLMKTIAWFMKEKK